MGNELAAKECVPCRGGVPPLVVELLGRKTDQEVEKLVKSGPEPTAEEQLASTQPERTVRFPLLRST